ncbi:hypothetical protein EDB81DRAFT_808724 [Dactylonectria macrodidyma]|uniref:NB-ARC domain-containing protein n=1 Tax=Dactylonectria macrodidyma TaxID=307937 RepID=A0A9P9E1W9_9HYPO|nr:hypothetical protein EDB81DRAFT_808724 [Dactylonectria macrodidyma]
MPLRQVFPDPSDTEAGATKIDIVAVHGLNPRSKNATDHAWDTWRTPPGPTGRLWLRDDLPQHVLGSRIFLYQYNATVIYGQDRDTFVGKASELLEALRVEREDVESRPIIFLGHSMGGILIKQALINAHENPKYSSIKVATTGIAFFATPHHGADKKRVGLGSAAAKIATTLGFEKGDGVMHALQSESLFSEAMQSAWRNQMPQYDVVSFWGAYDKMVPIENAKLGSTGDKEHVVKLNAGHGGVCRFGTTQDDQDNFKLVSRNIRDLYKKALHMVTEQAQPSTPIPRILSYPLSSLAPVKTFVQRPALRDSIRDQLLREPDAERQDEVKKVGIWGIGGAGKSQLALSYLQKYRKYYDATFWIQAGQRASIDQDFLAIYRMLPDASSREPNLSPECVKQTMLRWFSGQPGKLLIIFDGADFLHANDKGYVPLSQYIPGSSNVHVIITSRLLIVKSLSNFEGVCVGELETSQSVDLFLNCAEIPSSRDAVRSEAEEIVNELGNLALAVSMAGKYVSQTPRISSNLPAYLEDFRRRRHQLLSEKPEELTAGYNHSVMTVWETSYSAVAEQLPRACEFLAMLSFVHYEDISPDLFIVALSSTSGATEPVWYCDFEIYETENYFSILERYSLCQRSTDQASYSIHRLIHAWVYDRLHSEEDYLRLIWQSVSEYLRGYMKKLDDGQGTPASKSRLVPHLTKNLAIHDKFSRLTNDDKLCFLLLSYDCGLFLRKIGHFNEAVLSLEKVFNIATQALGPKHPLTIDVMRDLALALQLRGNGARAVPMMRTVVHSMRQTLGEEHPDTVTQMGNLGFVLMETSQVQEAKLVTTKVLETMRRTLGDNHHQTISAMCNLSEIFKDEGNLGEAESLGREALQRCQLNLGTDHPDTITAMNNLSGFVKGLGKLEEAESLGREALEMRKRVCGDEHHHAISEMMNLGDTLRRQGKLDESENLIRGALEKTKRILGLKNVRTMATMGGLAMNMRSQGKLEEAALLIGEVLVLRQQMIGDDHPGKISATSQLSIGLRSQGTLDDAAVWTRENLEKALSRSQLMLGDAHPDTIALIDNYIVLMHLEKGNLFNNTVV